MERELYGLPSFNFMASIKLMKSSTATHSAYIFYHLVFMLGLEDNMEHNTGNKFDEDPECLLEQVTYHALRAGHEIVRKEEVCAQVIYIWVSCFLMSPSSRKKLGDSGGNAG